VFYSNIPTSWFCINSHLNNSNVSHSHPKIPDSGDYNSLTNLKVNGLSQFIFLIIEVKNTLILYILESNQFLTMTIYI
jgi:hypothetical protein